MLDNVELVDTLEETKTKATEVQRPFTPAKVSGVRRLGLDAGQCCLHSAVRTRMRAALGSALE